MDEALKILLSGTFSYEWPCGKVLYVHDQNGEKLIRLEEKLRDFGYKISGGIQVVRRHDGLLGACATFLREATDEECASKVAEARQLLNGKWFECESEMSDKGKIIFLSGASVRRVLDCAEKLDKIGYRVSGSVRADCDEFGKVIRAYGTLVLGE